MKLNHRVAIPTKKTVKTHHTHSTSSSNLQAIKKNISKFPIFLAQSLRGHAFPPCDLLISRILLPAAQSLDRAVGEDVDADPSSRVGHAAHHALIVTFAVLRRWSKLVGG